MSITNIVQELVSQQVAPTPATLQQSGAILSQGATNTSQFTASFLTQESDLTPLLTGSKAITTAAWSGGVATYTCAAAHGVAVADTFEVTIVGFTPSGYNGTFLATSTGAATFTVNIAATLGAMSVAGSYTVEDVAELLAQVSTFFGQGSTQGVYVLELGIGSPNDGVAALNAYITANPNSAYTAGAPGYFYSYLVPRTWDGNASFIAFLAQFNAPSSKTYFTITTTLATYSLYPATLKCVKLFIESPALGVYPANALTAVSWSAGVVTATTTTAHGVLPGQWFQISGCTPAAYNGWAQAVVGTAGSTLMWALSSNPGAETILGTLVMSAYANAGIPATEFSAATDFQLNLNRRPSATNKVTPNSFAFVYGVTPFPMRGMSSLWSTLKTANVNIIGTGAEGGISTAIIMWGTTLDGNDFMYWYAADWVQINGDLNMANDVINGSNDPINPLYYDQPGIDREQGVLAATVKSAITFGMVLNPIMQTSLDGPALSAAIASGAYSGFTVINAIPFLAYSAENTGDYKIGKYSGFSVGFVPKRGFNQIWVTMVISQFPTS